MDNAVALVQAYLHVNGYFTVTEYPVLEALHGAKYRVDTDLDILAFRFPGAGHNVVGKKESPLDRVTDPVLACPAGQPDMIIAEVKEGQAELNRGATNLLVLQAVLARFGCCEEKYTEQTVTDLLKKGRTETPTEHQLRLIAFGSSHISSSGQRYQVIRLAHVIGYLQDYLRSNWSILRYAQFKHPAFNFLMLLEKAMAEQQADDKREE
jgi:hypothetical protein